MSDSEDGPICMRHGLYEVISKVNGIGPEAIKRIKKTAHSLLQQFL